MFIEELFSQVSIEDTKNEFKGIIEEGKANSGKQKLLQQFGQKSRKEVR